MDTTTKQSSRLGRWWGVVLFAVAMAWVESAVVLYLRSLSEHFDPYEPDPLPLTPHIVRAEMVREAATLVMLGSVGWLAGQTWRQRAALAVLAFGVWDVCYYVAHSQASALIAGRGWADENGERKRNCDGYREPALSHQRNLSRLRERSRSKPRERARRGRRGDFPGNSRAARQPSPLSRA